MLMRFRRRPLGILGLIMLLTVFFIAAFANVISPADPFKFSAADYLAPPSADHIWGADRYGRDLMSRIFHGARISLAVGFTVALIGGGIGGMLGIISGYMKGKFDLVFQRFVDITLAFPSLILAMAIVAALGFGVEKAIFAIAIPLIPRASRVVRSAALGVSAQPYVEAARVIGAGNVRIVLLHVVPNCMAPWLIILTAELGSAIIAEASLSFLGLGIQEPNPSWGLMLSGSAAQYAELAPWLVIFPGLALSFTVFAFNVLGDAVRDILDPRLRGGR